MTHFSAKHGLDSKKLLPARGWISVGTVGSAFFFGMPRSARSVIPKCELMIDAEVPWLHRAPAHCVT